MRDKTLLVAQRELVENIRTKAFWIGILLFPVLIVVMMVAPTLLERAKSARQYAVVDESGWLLEQIDQRAALPDLEKVFAQALERKRAGSSRFDELPEALRQATGQIEAGLAMVEEQAGGDWDESERAEAESTIIEGFASVVAGFAGTQGGQLREMLPPEAIAPLEQLREEIRRWWLELPAEEAVEYGSGVSKSRYVRVEVPGEGEEQIAELNRRVREGELFAYIVIGEDPINGEGDSRYVSSNLTDDDLQVWFSRLASDVLRAERLEEKQIDAQTADWIQAPFDMRQAKLGTSGEEEDVATQDRVRQWAPVAFVYLLWISVFTVAQMLLTNTVEEKSNKLMEVLLSSVSPLQLMMGKIVGIAATGLAMLGSWAVFFYLATKFVPRLTGIDSSLDLSIIVTDPKYMASFFVYFLLGYLFYAALLVGIGSVCDSLKEAQNLMTPIMLLLFVPLASMVPIGQDPNGLLARVMSYIPPFTPFVMMNRAAGPPSTLEYVLTSALLLASVGVVMWAAAKVFRIGVLMTGKPPKLREILRWIRAPIGVVPERRAEQMR
ncbi:MAG: ABC transporter permease [Acidobacteria bacterium]|nr:MAG: ABC transporter permease [Acidobacteriota bacterium]REK08321.1 MAG: ABC transporter permease [Acidobacteriota bacterium]